MRKTKGKVRLGLWIFCMVLAVFCIGCHKKEAESISLEEAAIPEEAEKEKEVQTEDSGNRVGESVESLAVHVCGRVAVPGVYELETGSRICDAVEAAGGMLQDAADEWINQAAFLEDGQKIYIPSREEVQEQSANGLWQNDNSVNNSAGASESEGRVNINKAGKEELMTLTGIGERKAEAILEYRESHGGFGSVEELMQVEGIKQGTYEKIKDQIGI